MIEFALLLVVFVLFGVLVLPIVALVQAVSAQREIKRLQERLALVEEHVRVLQAHAPSGSGTTASALTTPSTRHPGVVRTAEPAEAALPVAAAVMDAAESAAAGLPTASFAAATMDAAPQPTVVNDAFVLSRDRDASPPPPEPPFVGPELAPTPAPAAIAAAPDAPFNWEQFMGVKLFAWIGGVALLFTMVYFLMYSIDHGWLEPPVRAALGFVAGAGLIAGGLWSVRRDFAVVGQTLCATGIVVLYAVTYACRVYYRFELFQGAAASVLMVLITAAAFLLAVRLRAQVVGILGLLGGFVTPVMLSQNVDDPVGLFGYLALLDVGLLAVVLHRRWYYMAVLAALGTVAMEIGWADKFFTVDKLNTAVVACLTFTALFALVVPLARRLERASHRLAEAAIITAFASLCFSVYFSSLPQLASRPTWVLGTVLLADLALLGVAASYPPYVALHLAAGMAAFGATAYWIGAAATLASMGWAQGLIVLLAGLHAAFPLVFSRGEGPASAGRWAMLFPSVGLLAMWILLSSLTNVGWWLWPVVLVLDVMALSAAALTGWVVAALPPISLTLTLIGLDIVQLPLETLGALGAGRHGLLIGGFSFFFCLTSVWLVQRTRERGRGMTDYHEPPWLEYLPELGAGLPFVLLELLTSRLSPSNPAEVFSVTLLLDLLLLGLAAVFRHGASVAAAGLGTLLVEFGWYATARNEAVPHRGLPWFVGFAALFLLYPFVQRRRLLDLRAPWAVSALSLPLNFALIYQTVGVTWHRDIPGALAALCALPPLFGLLGLVRTTPSDAKLRSHHLAWFGAATLLFVTMIFPLQLSTYWLTVSWALEGAAVLWLYHRIPHPGLRIAGVGLLLSVFVRLVFNGEVVHYVARGAIPVFNWILLTYGVASLACFVGMRLLAPPRDRILDLPAPPMLGTLGTILAFVMVNLEIADYFTAQDAWIDLEFSGSVPRDMSYTMAWALFALTMLVAGIARRSRAPRYAGIALLVLACAKLFVHDTTKLDTIYRIAAFGVVSVLTIAASFLYQRFLRTGDQG